MNTKKLVWRLSKLPSVEELRELVIDKIITKDESREILFSFETEEGRDKKSLESEIKFLQNLVEKLSNNNNGRVVEIIREIERPWIRYPWYGPYVSWCSTSGNGNFITSGELNNSFSSIKTF